MDEAEIETLKDRAKRTRWVAQRIRALVRRTTELPENDFIPGRPASQPPKKIAENVRDIAFAYVLSGKEELARKVAESLLAYVDVVPTCRISIMKGLVTDATLSESPWAINMSTAYDFIYGCSALSDAEKKTVEDNVFRPCAEVLRICNHTTGSNWRARAISGLGTIGFCLGEKEYLEEALNGYYGKDGKLLRYGFVHHLAESILSDGIFYERSIGYHFSGLITYTQMAEVARH